ncbi:esterase/lipase family protein [Amycolatopsis jiangsuensis]|uniref:Triacylglycerol esterase/lipase EstA (Alpha/beta hydrolase family) n=1 Tax=Amycolatopsis jiangsuensis TaxID=1181879 RepID=A0A840IUJ5_9PSEU|nr:alpha/beta fold hydrolase [Amycolatopsis jiangsuensis]MBB4686146.1 triacylglycerol esterase/lipase EstA (alpha/beta hydrolase family) [Amycolatopsis jiangsuensis]
MGMRGFGRRMVAVAAALGAVALTTGTASAADKEPTGPVQPNIVAAAIYSVAQPTIAPPGANDWDCTPSEDHPNPVLLSNGTTANAYENWANLSQLLADEGYCVFAGNFGGSPGSVLQTVGPVAGTASQLATFGDKVLEATGASKLDVVGHSQGGMNPRYWIKNLGGASKIDKLIGLSPSNYGTSLFGLLSAIQAIPPARDVVGAACPSCNEQSTGSEFITDLNAGGDTVPDVDYTVIQTKYDEVVTPYTNAYLKPASNVKNILLQDICSQDFTDHLGIPYDPIAQREVLNALDPQNAVTPKCVYVPPVIG